MNNHTDGKWLVSTFAANGNAADIYVEDYHGEGETTICKVSGDIEPDEHMANARLIAAAPMMIEALERVDEELQTWYDAGGSHREVLTELVKAAIRAAKGE